MSIILYANLYGEVDKVLRCCEGYFFNLQHIFIMLGELDSSKVLVKRILALSVN